jgi:hypothetical protein
MALHAETILDAIVTALDAIRDDTGASFAPVLVARWDRYTAETGPLPSILVKRRRIVRDREEQGGGWRCDLEVDVWISIAAETDGSVPTDKAETLAAGDVEQAINGMDWQTLEANLARIESRSLWEEDEQEPNDGAIVSLVVQYKLAYEDLETVIEPF